MVSAKSSTRTSNVVIVIMYVAEQTCATNKILLLVHPNVTNSSRTIEEKQRCLLFLADQGPKQEVKACYQCKGAENCRPERLSAAEIRTSAVLGASNLYCFTVCPSFQLDNINDLFLVYFAEIRS